MLKYWGVQTLFLNYGGGPTPPDPPRIDAYAVGEFFTFSKSMELDDPEKIKYDPQLPVIMLRSDQSVDIYLDNYGQ